MGETDAIYHLSGKQSKMVVVKPWGVNGKPTMKIVRFKQNVGKSD